jgi:hypothetical protein
MFTIDKKIIDKRQGNYQETQSQSESRQLELIGRSYRCQQSNNEPKMNAFQQPRNDPGFNPISQNSSGNSLDKDDSKETGIESKKTDDEEEEPEWFALSLF